jgi:hypothetical protein
VHELSAADALRPSPVCILNLPLSEYSLGHELLLFRRRNALVILSETAFSELDFALQIHAIREAVWICSDSFSARDRFERPSWFMAGFRWNEWKRKRWAKRLKHLTLQDYALAAAEFRNYLSEAQSCPPIPTKHAISVLYPDDKNEHGRGFGQPFFLTLYQFVIGLPKDEWVCATAWDFPYARALWLYFAKCEAEGAYRIENAKERQVQAELEQFEREIAEEKAAEQGKVPDTGGLATVPPDLNAEGGNAT